MNELIQLTEHDNGVAVLTFNRPDAMNALNIAAMEIFLQHISDLQEDDDLRALILTGAGEVAFCSGGDLVALREKHSEADARYFITTMGDALLAMERLPVPVIAAINGYALGGGSEIALACDIRIADSAVKMGMVQINMALTPGWGAGQRLMRIVGYAKAMQILLDGAVMRGEQCLELGLVNQLVDEGKALEVALGLANDIANRPRAVVRGIKGLLQAGLNHPYEQALHVERDIFPPLWADKPHLDAVENFFKRQANKRQSNGDES